MKRAFSIFASLAVFALTAGCVHGQQPVTPPVVTYTCPTPGNGAYALLAPPSGSTSFTATGVSAQTCYIAQGVLGSQTGSWSNVAGPTIGGATGKVSLSLTCTPGSGTTCTGDQWEFSAAPATAVTATAPAVPSMGAPTTSQMVKPEPTVASNVPTVKLKAAGL